MPIATRRAEATSKVCGGMNAVVYRKQVIENSGACSEAVYFVAQTWTMSRVLR